MPAETQVYFFTPGALTDAGGLAFYIGSDGKVHVVRIPPWNPEVLSEINAAVHVLNQAASIKNEAVQQRFTHLAESVVQSRAKEITGSLNRVDQANA